MANLQGSNSGLPFAGMVLLVAMVSAIFVVQPPLTSSRPDSLDVGHDPHTGIEDVPARLWQDPLAVVRRHADVEKEHDRDNHKELIKSSADEVLTIMLVMVNGGPYVENAERRMRSRYAVLSGLQIAGYFPTSADHVGYVEVPIIDEDVAYNTDPAVNTEVATIDEDTAHVAVPFEWFETNGLNTNPAAIASKKVLLLWLNDNHFSERPLKKIAQVIRELGRKPNHDRIRILGPAGSTTLRSMLREGIYARKELVLRGAKVYSPNATAVEELFAREILLEIQLYSNILNRENIVWWALKKWEIDFLRVGNTDIHLTLSLIEELEKRGFDVLQEEQKIAIITEWDTFYGRALPIAFRAALSIRQEELNEGVSIEYHRRSNEVLHDHLEKVLDEDRTGRLHRFTYMQGIDGKTVNETGGQAVEDQSTIDGDQANGGQAIMERPENRSQFDYIRRLADRIEALNTHSLFGNDTLKAIGVLGSDVYDKILLMDALRSRFPDTIFFTTDLDARFLHPAHLRSTRNLVVASSFGLSLHDDMQRDIPPFRDTYQTATFLSTLLALDEPRVVEAFRGEPSEQCKLNNEQCKLDQLLTPRLFEVGWRGAVDLSAAAISNDQTHLHPSRRGLENLKFRAGVALVTILLFLYVAYRLIDGVRIKMAQCIHAICRHPFVGLITVVAPILVLVSVAWFLQSAIDFSDEPFSMFDGVSIWPTLMLRIVTIVACLIFLNRAWVRLRENQTRLSSEFFGLELPKRGKTATKPGDWISKLMDSFRKWFRVGLIDRVNDYFEHWANKKFEVKNNVIVIEKWQKYLELGSSVNRHGRFLTSTVAFLLLGIAMGIIFGMPHVPYRGPVSRVAEIVTLLLTLSALTYLTFFVVDATLLCRRFIEILTGRNPIWPKATIKNFGKEGAISEDLLKYWLIVKLIATRTSVVSQLIYYPFIGLLLLITSRINYFDSWTWPFPLVAIYSAIFTYSLYCALTLSKAARRAKNIALGRFKEELLLVKEEHESGRHRAKQINLEIEKVEGISEGAFLPFSKHPVVGAIIGPVGAIVALVILQIMGQF